jgi:hypothetical protein
MRLTLRTATKAALKEYGRLPREQWALQHPGQLVTLVSNIFWCQVSHHGCYVVLIVHLLVSATVYGQSAVYRSGQHQPVLVIDKARCSWVCSRYASAARPL